MHQRCGFSQNVDGGPQYFILPEAWKSEVLAGHDAGRIARALADRGHIKVIADGKPAITHRLPDGTQRKVYVILPTLFEGGAE